MNALTVHDAFAWEAWNEQHVADYQSRTVPPEVREEYARTTSLREFYRDCEMGRWEPIGRKPNRARGTKQKERQVLNRWERYTRPEGWPSHQHWPGPSLAFLETVGPAYFEQVYRRMEEDLAHPTVASTRAHLRTMLNHAHRVGAILKRPLPARMERRDPRTRIYTPEEVARILPALETFPQLRVAFWLGLHIGARPVDLFCLRWSDFIKDARGRRLVEFESRKTGKLQAVPISVETWKMVQSLPANPCGYLFVPFASPDSDDPEKSYPARTRNGIMKQLLSSVGVVDVAKPWQVARATCNERFESHRPGVGPFILGHSLQGVNARSYRQPTEAVHEAVRTLPPYTVEDRQRRLF